MDLKTYQALASQLEQIAEILIADHADRVQFRNEIRIKLSDLATQQHSPHTGLANLTKNDLKTLIVKVGPWVIAAAEAIAHVVRSLHH
jgi:hypothetical protein